MHLHNHTEYSMLDGAAKIMPMLVEAQRLQMPAVGMTDHGNMFGASEFYTKATEVGYQAHHRGGGLRRARSRSDTKRITWAIRARRPTTSRPAAPTCT